MNDYKLAIIIPAYKGKYLKETLQSFQKQTDQRFNLYVGDDCSPDNIEAIFSEFSHLSNFHYHKFQSNIGKYSLTDQWNRCVDLCQNEQYIWLFGDDDVCDEICVSKFYEIQKRSKVDLYRFNLKVINDFGDIIIIQAPYPPQESHIEFARKRFGNKIISSVNEYIFNKESFINHGRFEKFPLAWCSDDATWIKLSMKNGIKTIPEAIVKWRLSEINISSQPVKHKREIIIAIKDYIEWFNNNVINIKLQKEFYKLEEKWLKNQLFPFKNELKPIDLLYLSNSFRSYNSLKKSWLYLKLNLELFHPKISYLYNKLFCF
ncbi:MAG: glycosyltransferase family 2 protein [Ignavibacteriales bacterium]|nr:glycosyltransferase family 2 protein [Ignavibacteriales bacterium]